ncbi:hypothetical protein [uncultured Roseobacter sp.]|uniref:AbiU2 domain-containing protein n=1 Tax=uncultured Roseobacter sp. TaxID=114847 RepID=UPI00260F4FB5|nr:hypothetical protein [uncultured Roseobacter sp.]
MSDVSLREKGQIDQIVDELDQAYNSSLYDIGFLSATIGNPNVKKIDQSFSGHALDVAIRAVVAKVVLYVARCWENNGSSVLRAAKLLKGWGERIETERREEHPDWSDESLEIGQVEAKIEKLHFEAHAFIERADYKYLRVHRDEELAHHLRGKSASRRKLEETGVAIDPATYDQVVELAQLTAEFFSRILQIWRFTIKHPENWIDNSKDHTELFWEILPDLAEQEGSR